MNLEVDYLDVEPMWVVWQYKYIYTSLKPMAKPWIAFAEVKYARLSDTESSFDFA